MSTAAPASTKKEWLAIIPDKAPLSARLAVRAQHLADVKPEIGKTAVLGGATLKHHPTAEELAPEGPGPQMNGSVLVYLADTEEEVWGLIKGDIYAKEGVWDLERTTVTAIKTAFRVGS